MHRGSLDDPAASEAGGGCRGNVLRWHHGPMFQLQLLGPLQLRRGDSLIELRVKKSQALLALVVRRAPRANMTCATSC